MAILKRRLRRWNGSSYDTIYFETDASVVTGTLPVSHGGLGRTNMRINGILAGNSTPDTTGETTTTKLFQSVQSKSGALYSTGTDVLPAFGTLPVAQGGTGATAPAAARTNLGITPANIGAAASSHNHAAGDVTSGSFGVARGGTGRTTLTANAVLAGNTTSAVKMIATASGALYATAANGAPAFGTLPAAQGGTGNTSLQATRNAMGLGNTTGALPVANGGTGATDRLTAFKNITNQAVASPQYVVGFTSSWATAGYTSIAQLKTTLGVPAAPVVISSDTEVQSVDNETVTLLTFASNVVRAEGYIVWASGAQAVWYFKDCSQIFDITASSNSTEGKISKSGRSIRFRGYPSSTVTVKGYKFWTYTE